MEFFENHIFFIWKFFFKTQKHLKITNKCQWSSNRSHYGSFQQKFRWHFFVLSLKYSFRTLSAYCQISHFISIHFPWKKEKNCLKDNDHMNQNTCFRSNFQFMIFWEYFQKNRIIGWVWINFFLISLLNFFFFNGPQENYSVNQ